MDESLDPKIEQLIEGWSAKRREFAAVDTNRFVAQVKESIELEVSRRDASCVRPSERTEPRTHEASLRWSLSAVAVIIIIGFIGIKYYNPSNTSPTKTYSTTPAQ